MFFCVGFYTCAPLASLLHTLDLHLSSKLVSACSEYTACFKNAMLEQLVWKHLKDAPGLWSVFFTKASTS